LGCGSVLFHMPESRINASAKRAVRTGWENF
jgi:hypothetical protein